MAIQSCEQGLFLQPFASGILLLDSQQREILLQFRKKEMHGLVHAVSHALGRLVYFFSLMSDATTTHTRSDLIKTMNR